MVIEWRCHAQGIFVVGLMMTATGAMAGGEPIRDPDQPVDSATGAMVPAGITQGVVGRVVTPAGRPIVDALITVQSVEQPAKPVPEIAILSGADGRFSWPLRPGRYRLAAKAEGRELAAATTTVAPGQVTTIELSAAH